MRINSSNIKNIRSRDAINRVSTNLNCSNLSKYLQIIIADKPAFCYGVQRAFELAKNAQGQKLFMYGPLIHNPQIVKQLKTKGFQEINDFKKLKKGDTVIIRAHGVSQKTKQHLVSLGVKIIDGTCPFVAKSHLIAQKIIKKGHRLIIIGNKNHPEIKAIVEDFPEAIVIKSLEEAQQCNISAQDKLGVMCQTTIKLYEAEKIVNILRKKTAQVCFENTICNATHEKQTSAKKLAQNVDIMIVVGGKNSNNTKMLQQICQKNCPTYLISEISEIQQQWFKNIKKTGITGGASTPMWLIEKVEEKIRSYLV